VPPTSREKSPLAFSAFTEAVMNELCRLGKHHWIDSLSPEYQVCSRKPCIALRILSTGAIKEDPGVFYSSEEKNATNTTISCLTEAQEGQ
jgi:hypothetical protein